MKYFISDTHFGHQKMVTLERTQFETIEEHDETVMQVLETVHPDDELYILGDFGFIDGALKERFFKIKAKKILVKGNHDTYSNDFYSCKYGFDEIHSFPAVYISKRILLSHEPQPVNNEIINVHGHLHNAHLDFPNYLNVNIHDINYQLVSLKQIEKLVMKTPKISHKFLEEWYREHYCLTKQRDDILVKKDAH